VLIDQLPLDSQAATLSQTPVSALAAFAGAVWLAALDGTARSANCSLLPGIRICCPAKIRSGLAIKLLALKIRFDVMSYRSAMPLSVSPPCTVTTAGSLLLFVW